MRCGECGSKKVKLKNVQGRSFKWKDYSSVALTRDLKLFVCDECKNIILKPQDAKLLDTAIEASIAEQVRAAIHAIIRDNKCEQKDIASRLGVTPEYLSLIKNGHQSPSFQVFNFLKTMALDKVDAYKFADPNISMDIKSALTIKLG